MNLVKGRAWLELSAFEALAVDIRVFGDKYIERVTRTRGHVWIPRSQ